MHPQDHISRTVEVFCSYSHRDADLQSVLYKHLRPLIRQEIIRTWHDGEIRAGDEWSAAITDHLEAADIILLLISADFLASDYIWHVELPRAMQRHEAGEAKVIPIILHEIADFETMPFSKLQALPSNAKAVERPDNNAAFVNIARGIRESITEPESLREVIVEEGQLPAEPDDESRWLVPYLCDRSDQEREMTEALQGHQATMPRRPFVCIIHGDEFESHGYFLERMKVTSIGRTLNLAAKQLSLEEYPLQWPSSAVPRARYLDVFRSYLGDSLLQNTAASPEDIIKYIAPHEKPLLLKSIVLTEDFHEPGTDLLDAFLKFWNAWPDLPPGRTLISCVFIKHQRLNIQGFFQKRKMQKLTERLRTYLATLDWSLHPGMYGVLLTELKAIHRRDVEVWALNNAVRAVRRIGENEIRALFERRDLCSADGLISMERLADELKKLLSPNRERRND